MTTHTTLALALVLCAGLATCACGGSRGGAVQCAAAYNHTCAVLDSGALRCWGTNWQGQLGHGITSFVGDDEPPSALGDVPVF